MARTAKSIELRQKRAELEAKIKGEVEKDSLTTEQRTAVNAMVADSDNLKAQYELIERSDETEKELRESVKKIHASQPAGIAAETSVLSNDGAERKAQTSKAFRDFLKNGKDGMAPESRSVLDAEKRTYAPLQVGNAAAGYFVPQGFSYEFDEAMKQTGGMLEACRNYPTDSGNPLLWPMVDDTANAAVIVGEGAAFTGLNPVVTHLTLGAFKYGSLVQATLEQLEDSAFDIESWLRDEFVTRFARGVNADLTHGSGSGAPQGIVGAVSAGQTTASGQVSSLLYDDLVDLVHSVDPAYRRSKSCRFQFHDDTIRSIRLIKDSFGHPIFQTDPTSDLPDRILGFEFTVNQDLSTLAVTSPVSARTVGLFGDMSKYVIRKVNGLFVQKLVERYAELGLVGFLGWARYDGNLATASTKAITKLVVSAT
jgi:HK97 family phage major capsid protein